MSIFIIFGNKKSLTIINNIKISYKDNISKVIKVVFQLKKLYFNLSSSKIQLIPRWKLEFKNFLN